MEYLFSPVKVGSLTLKNRIVMPAMHLGYCNDKSEVTDRLVSFYEERAQGGAAMIFIGGCPVDEYASSMKEMIGLSDDRFIPGLKGSPTPCTATAPSLPPSCSTAAATSAPA